MKFNGKLSHQNDAGYFMQSARNGAARDAIDGNRAYPLTDSAMDGACSSA